MHRFRFRLVYALTSFLVLTEVARSDDWTTVGSDAQRSSWVRADMKISPGTVRGPDFQFLWKMPLANDARSGNALTGPALLDLLIGYRGFRTLAFVGASDGGVFAMDTDLARMEWERRFPSKASASTPECPGGMTANLTRPTPAAMPSKFGIRGRGQRAPAKSGVGAPDEGAVTLANRPASTRLPSSQTTSERTRPPAKLVLEGVFLVYSLTADGMLHGLYVSHGRDRFAPIPFLPANANARGLIVVDDVAYVATSNECGGVPDGVWALDLESGRVTTWRSNAGSVVGSAGVAISPDGTVYVATRNGPLVALEARSLQRKAVSASTGFRSSPVVFDYDGRDYIAAMARDGALHVFDATNLQASIAKTAARSGGQGAEDALAAWRDASGTHWIVAPSVTSVIAWKLKGNAGGMRLEKGWESPKMATPLPPIVVNGVVFALSGGESNGHAKLYALEGTSGKLLWDSGMAIESGARGHTLASGPGHVYLTASDSTLYTFGIPMEH